MSRAPVVALTPEQVGERLGIAVRSVQRLIESGALPAIDVRSSGTRPRLRVTEAALAEFVASRAVAVTPRRRRAS